MIDGKFHVDNEVIITTNDSVDVEEVFNHLKGRLHEFREKSEFIVISGNRTDERGKIGQTDNDLQQDFQNMLDRFHDAKRYPEESKIVKKRQFKIGTVIPIRTNRDFSQEPKIVHHLSEATKININREFENVLFKQVPIVLVLAACYSFRSDIFYTLRASGLSSAITMLQERGNITNGKLNQLDDEQRNLLKHVANGDTKDVIVGGKLHTVEADLFSKVL